MLSDFTGADKVYIACGYTDLRRGIDGLATIVQQQFELDPFIRRSVKKFAGEFISKRLSLELEPSGASVVSDEKWLAFVVEQVLSNSLKYTREGSVRIYLAEPKTLCIRDTGIGIAPEDMPRIFDKGYTGLNGRADLRASGIGLYLCSTILKKLGHSFTITSQEGTGTRVTIGFPEES